jgi:hypothetical protein
MALKMKITKAVYDKLSDDLKKEYVEDGDSFKLDTDADDADELRRARDREKQNAKDAKKEAKELRDRLAELEGDDARKSGDIEKIDKQWKDKFAARETELTGKLSAKDEYIKKTMIDGAAGAMASKISTSPSLLKRAIADRLTVNFEGDEPKLEILGADGKVANTNLDALEKEFVTNKEFSSIIIASKASGGGAPRNGPDNKPGGVPASDREPMLAKMQPKDLVAAIKARKETEA